MHRMLLLTAALAAPLAAEAATFGPEPLIWSHRGSSYLARENTLPAFELSAQQGADGFELDLFLTADNQLAVFHDPDLNRLTNVEDAFPLSRARDTDGDSTPDTWFIADFTMDELRTLEIDNDSRPGRVALQADPRNPAPQPSAYRIPTYAEALDLAEALGQKVLTEVKLTDAGDAAERAAVQDLLIAEWQSRGYTDGSSPVVVQAFSDIFMSEIDAKLGGTNLHVPTVQLNFDAAAREVLATNDPSLYVPSQEALEQIIGERYGDLDGIAVILDVLLGTRGFSDLLNPLGLDFIAAADANGLDIYAWTFRIDDGVDDPAATADAYFDALETGDLSPYYEPYLELFARGLDGVITDNPDIARAARDAFLAPVPLPATVWLLGAGVLALSLRRRR
ncbi:MAG: glycerophosphodiester phosphodiesterase family protein [Pseudomonadota bacterium]